MKKADFSENNIQSDELYRRDKTRWLMVFYDTVFYIICWFAILLVYFGGLKLLVEPIFYLYFVEGYVLFFGFRFLLECYKCIYRYGKIYVFSRELLAGVLAAICLIVSKVCIELVFHISTVAFAIVLSFSMTYIIFSIFTRFVYCYSYRYAMLDKPLSRLVKKVLVIFAAVDFDSETPGAVYSYASESENEVDLSPINEMQRIIDCFEIHGEVIGIKQINKGYINRTYKITTLSKAGHTHKYLLQRINTNVFPDVCALMENFELTTKHLHEKLQLPGKHAKGTVQTLRPLKEGGTYLVDDSGCWRMMTYFDHVMSMDIPESPHSFYYAGVAFGSFVKEMSDVYVHKIKEVIPNFHNTLSRYRDLEKSIETDKKDRVKNVTQEIEFIRSRVDNFGIISDAIDSGKIPLRICHNDCNLNNILFDIDTHLPVAIIDFDTVMPSSPLYDYGDSMRIGTNTAVDDEKDLSKVSCNLELYEQYARGYLEACVDLLTKEELELLPYASLVITAEDGIRFLKDYIDGDIYYHIYYPGQNLDRARTQLKLLEDMENKLPQIKQILQKIYDDLGLKVKII